MFVVLGKIICVEGNVVGVGGELGGLFSNFLYIWNSDNKCAPFILSFLHELGNQGSLDQQCQ